MHRGRTGTLSTVSRKHPGWPFGSVMPYSLDAHGRPAFLISTMAMHTQNLRADPRASLLVTQPGWTGDPLAGARVTVMGLVTELLAADLESTRAAYLARHEHAAAWVDFDDFGFYQLEVTDVYYVGGFGAMGWVLAVDYTAAEPDPLADVAPEIIDHMNQGHADALRLFCRVYAGVTADEAVMTSVDRLGFQVRVRTGERVSGVRLTFMREVRSAQDARTVLVAMVREAREKERSRRG
jgi:putative heme iron utilization protein